MAIALLLLVAQHATAAADWADKFLVAHRRGDEGEMAVLAARPASQVEYALVVHTLRQNSEADAAKALVVRRGGPERAGLERLLETKLPTARQEAAWLRAESYVQQPARCLAELEAAGPLIEGTLHGARIQFTRARTLLVARKTEEAAKALEACGRFARNVGWLAKAREAELLRLKIAPSASAEALAALDQLVPVLQQLDEREDLMRRQAQRGSLRLRRGKVEDGRKDLRAAIDLAQRLKRSEFEAQLWIRLALHFQLDLNQPTQARSFYDNALELLRGTKSSHYAQALHNAAIVATDLGKYPDALRLVEELLRCPDLEPPRRVDAHKQRAYVLRRTGRVVDAAAAYAEALATATGEAERLGLRVELGRLAVTVGDLRAAERDFETVLAEQPNQVAALLGRASVRAMRGDAAGAEADYAAVLKRATGARGRVLLQRASARRMLGHVAAAREDATEALRLLIAAFEDDDKRNDDYGNTAVAWGIVGDLLLLEGQRKAAVESIERGAVFFYKLADIPRAIPAYARWTLLLDDADSVLQRFQVLRKMAERTPFKSLKSTARCVAGILAWKNNQPKDAALRFAEAVELAPDSGHRATALAQWALVEPSRAMEALALTQAERLTGPVARPFVEGETAEYAASIGLRGTPDPAAAFALIERARADRLLVALRGRAAVLDALLPDVLYKEYAAARAALMQARAIGDGAAAAEDGFDAMVAKLREHAPEAAALAFPKVPVLAEVQRALRKDEALLLMLDDPYVRCLVAVTPGGATRHDYDPKDPLKGVPLDGVKKLLVAPDGRLSMDTAPWASGVAIDAFEVFHVPSAGAFLRLRGKGAGVGTGGRRRGPGPVRLAVEDKEPCRLLHIGTPVRLDLVHPQASSIDLRQTVHADAVVFANTTLAAGDGAGVDAVSAAAAVAFAHGARQAILSLAGAPPDALWDALYANCLDNAMTPAFGLLQARRAIREEHPRFWSGVVVWGVPAH